MTSIVYIVYKHVPTVCIRLSKHTRDITNKHTGTAQGYKPHNLAYDLRQI